MKQNENTNPIVEFIGNERVEQNERLRNFVKQTFDFNGNEIAFKNIECICFINYLTKKNMTNKEEIARILLEIENTCEYCNGHNCTNDCDMNDKWQLSEQKALEIAERILE